MFPRILVPTDGSEASLRAVAFAAELAAQHLSEILVLTVVQVPQSLVIIAGTGDVVEDYVREAGREVLDRAQAVLSKASVSASERMEVGSPGKVIVETARTSGASLVVMGKCGHGELAGILLGSVSDHVAHHLEVPLVLVP